MKQVFTLLVFTLIYNSLYAQSWLTGGNGGTNAATNFLGTTDNTAFVFRTNNIERGRMLGSGEWRFGTTANYAQVDVAGKLSFAGTGAYYVAGNKYAFQYALAPNYGLFFNSTGVQYEFKDGNALPVFYINANTGNGVFKGNLKIGAYTLPATDGTNGQALITNGAGIVSWQTVNGGGGANTSLSNLTATSVNQSLVPAQNSIYNLGSSIKSWSKIYFSGEMYVNSNRVFNIINSSTSVGSLALANNNNVDNTAVGFGALYTNTTSSGNTSTGAFSMYSATGVDNSAFGRSALYSSSGDANSAFGFSAMSNSTAGSFNCAFGNETLFYNSGNNNVAVGNEALYFNDKGYSNVVVGAKAMYNNKNAVNQVAIGDSALYSCDTSGIPGNTAVGSKALFKTISGANNTANGFQSLYNNTGSSNTAVGFKSLNVNTSGKNNTCIGANAYPTTSTISNYTGIGYNVGTSASASNMVEIGDYNVTVIRGNVNFSTYSDARIKNDIKQNVPGLTFINLLKPVTYKIDLSKETAIADAVNKLASSNNGKSGETEKSDIEMQLKTGFIAQEVEAAAKKINYDFSGVVKPQNKHDLYSLRYAEFVVPLVKAVQELSKMNEDKDARLTEQQKINSDLQQQINELKAMIVSKQSSASNQLSISLSPALLSQNIPNPFSTSTIINYTLPANYSSAKIIISDKKGSILKQVNLDHKGNGSINIDASTMADGSYQYSLFINNQLIAAKQMLIMH